MTTFIIIISLYLSISIALAAIECAVNGCTEDEMKNNLLLWYDEWLRGFEIDYITINELRDSYDFIVVGAGIGGSIVAHRLAMDPSYPKVLLLEAGGKQNTSGLSKQMVPAQTADNQLTNIDWQYQSEPSGGYCCEMYNETRHQLPRGKVTGGSAVLNYMMWMRGHKEDWDTLFNVDGWKWKDVLPFFEKIETLHRANHKVCKNVQGRGCDGAIIVNDARNLGDKNSIFDESALNAFLSTKKFKFLEDGQNSVTGSNIGAAYTEFNIDDTGHRNDAFLGYNKYMRSTYKNESEDGLINLDILTKAHVTKILFDDNSDELDDLLRAKGVEFADLNDNKKLYNVDLSNINGEIILGAGAINTPQILMLSGLGPKDELNKHNIQILREIAGIGNNLQDHPALFLRYHFKTEYGYNEAITAERIERTLNNFTLFKDYLFEGKSVLSISGANVGGFIRSHVMNAKYGTKDTYPDLQFTVIPGFHAHEAYQNQKENYFIDYECGEAEYYVDKDNVMNIVAVVILLHPESRGWIKLNSSNPFDFALFQANHLKQQFDVDVLKEGYKIIHEVMLQPSMKKLWDKTMACKKYGDVLNNDRNLEKYIRDSVTHVYHPVGTCAMGDIVNNKMAVIDNRLLVGGTINLRIADASIFPYQTSGNTQTPTYMIGEKASYIILKKWNS